MIYYVHLTSRLLFSALALRLLPNDVNAFHPHNSIPYIGHVNNGPILGFAREPSFQSTKRMSSASSPPSTILRMQSLSSNVPNQKVMETDTILTTKSSVLDEKLTEEERTVVNVVRTCGPSVAYVSSSVLPPKSSRRRSRRGRNDDGNNKQRNDRNRNPGGSENGSSGRPLGSGSAFCISSEGYFITNYHVIEQAYTLQQNRVRAQRFISNVTQPLRGLGTSSDTTGDTNSTSPLLTLLPQSQVYLRLSPTGSSSTTTPNKLQACRIVAVRPEVDIAILHLPPSTTDKDATRVPAIPYGSSTSLLVGQSVLAIGNPFGLTQTLTTGVVSALDRAFPSTVTLPNGRKKDIRGCVQTDAAINPGNSGGPLLDGQGRVIGVNAAIVSPSGASAGIGFAIGMDDGLKGMIKSLVEKDLEELVRVWGRKRGWLGASLVEEEGVVAALWKKMNVTRGDVDRDGTAIGGGVFVMDVKKGSPAQIAGINPLQYLGKGGRVQAGDRIVALGGAIVDSPAELMKELSSRVEGEKISITVEDRFGTRRVVYASLKDRKNSKGS